MTLGFTPETKWIDTHPGGGDPLIKKAGKDASVVFKLSHPPEVLET